MLDSALKGFAPMQFKHAVREWLQKHGTDIRYIHVPQGIPDRKLYRPTFSPWYGDAFQALYEKIKPYTLVSPDRCFALYSLAHQASRLPGSFVECGVYRGGTAMLLANIGKPLHLYDTFAGMRNTDPNRDLHRAGDFADTSLDAVRALVPSAVFHPGWIPETFGDLPDKISFAHIDLDLYRPILDCCEHFYARMPNGAFMVFDDYGFPSCPGARQAVDEFFADKSERPLVLNSGHAIVFIQH
jgi:O-methyltransferase